METRKAIGRRVKSLTFIPTVTDLPFADPPEQSLEALVFEDGSRLEFYVETTHLDYRVGAVFVPKESTK